MPEFIYKDKCRIKSIEFEMREINADGDVIHVDFFETEKEAIEVAKGNAGLAVVVEKHTSCRPAHLFKTPNKFETIFTGGSSDALAAGGWIDEL